MSTLEAISAGFALLIIAVTIWQIARHGIADNNGNVDGVNSYDHTRGGDGS